MTAPSVVVRDAVVRFGDRLALDGVSMAAHPGSVTVVVGGDGAGKTTLLRAVVGQVALDSGSVLRPGLASIGYLPATLGSWRGLTVQENVDFVGGSYRVPADRLAQRAADLLGAAGLDPFRDRLAGQLSGGMRRKLGVCLAMLHDPDVLVLDEPSTGVDPVSRVDLWRQAAQAAAGGTAVLLSTTYLDEAERAGHVLVLDAGRVLVSGPPGRVAEQMPGLLTEQREPVRPAWAWRRGREFRELWADEAPPDRLRTISPELADVVIAHALRNARTERAPR